jgi:glycosyltransferase involved in cell wall biosynthesis
MKKKTIVYIAPHLSTGGMPQYLVKQIETIKEDVEVYCIEWDNVTGGVLVVQRNKMVNLLGDRLITLGEPREHLFTLLDRIKPDVVHLQEIPELFMPPNIADRLYNSNRTYVIIETSHDSSYNVQNKMFLPDKFLMVSQYQIDQYKALDIPIDLVEYPIENKIRTKTRDQALRNLGLDPNLKHVINVGLFTPRKNQAEVIEYARQLRHYPIQFHFIGNQADNFKHYWEPLMQNFPPNCKWWNERSDVDNFYEAADLFLFTSRGNDHDKETMPLVIREALSWKTPSMIYNLPVYMGYFDTYETIEYLSEDAQRNAFRIAEKLLREPQPTFNIAHNIAATTPQKKECIVITAYPNSSVAEELTKQCILDAKQFNLPIILTTHCAVSHELQALVDYCIVDKNNILTKHTYYNTFRNDTSEYYVEVNLRRENNDMYHGPAVQTTYYNAIGLAHTLGFENAYCWNYDVWTKDPEFVNMMRSGLHSHKLVTHQFRAEEGQCLKSVLFGTDTKFFLEVFPRILTEADYTNWMAMVESESNGLENMWYHTLKHTLDLVKLWSPAEYEHIVASNQMDMCSMSEYTTVLPIDNDNKTAMAWFWSGNTIDRRIVHIYGDDTILYSAEITHKSYCYIPIKLGEINTVTFEIVDADSKNILRRKVIPVSVDSIANNGIFRYKQ